MPLIVIAPAKERVWEFCQCDMEQALRAGRRADHSTPTYCL